MPRSASLLSRKSTQESFFYRSAGALGCHTRIRAGFPRDGSSTVFFIVARGPVPRDRPSSNYVFRSYGSEENKRRFFSVVCDRLITNGSGAGAPELQGLAREGWRGTGPRPTVKVAFFFRSAGACPPRWPSSSYVFRSFRSLMSIAACVGPFSRSFRSLIKWQRGEPRHIKVLQTLGCSVVQDAIDIKVLQTLGMARDRLLPYDERKALFLS